ncbi:hypothetical protein NP233_g35 [Leucocoprinus birnbaumii]|uniref:Secreted protein n=1 Tax=Leucocoprinus birnbaumii TaxID=56174 RepID=A0AAD5Z0K5_9AGAR|nr:hypothetical protein NP233_g35 [Leucocoprinus birnbaumii]
MHTKALLVLAFTAVALARSTNTQDVLDGISELEAQSASMRQQVQQILAEDKSSLTDAISLHNSVNKLMGRSEEAVNVIKMVSPSPGSVEDCDAVIGALEKILPDIEAGLKLVTDKKPVIDGMQGGRISAIVALDLMHLKQCVTNIQDALFDAAPPGCLNRAYALKEQFNDPYNLAVAAYNTK